MSYVARIIGSDERLIGVARLHWVYIAKGFGWFLFFVGSGIWMDHLQWKYFGKYVPLYDYELFGAHFSSRDSILLWILTATGCFLFLTYLSKTLATEVALTSRRIIYKTGLIFVEIEEVELEEIKGERIRHGLLGRFLGYGELLLDCRFIGDVYLPAIRKPYRFLKAMHAARTRLEDGLAYVVGNAAGHPVRLHHGRSDNDNPRNETQAS